LSVAATGTRSPRATLVTALGVCAVGCAATVAIGKAPFNLFFWSAVLVFAALAAVERRTLPDALGNPVVAGGLALFLLYAASLLWTSAPTAEAARQLGSYRVLLMPLIFLPALADPRLRERTLRVMLAALALVLLLSWVQAFVPLPFARASQDPIGIVDRDAYVFNDRIRQSIHLSLLLLWAGGIALLATALPRKPRIAAAVLAMLCVINLLWLVKGRTGYVLVGALALFLLHARAGAAGLAVAVLSAGVAAAAAALGLPVVSARIAGTLGEIRDYLQTGANNATGERLEMWSNSLRMIADAPLLGHGVDAYQGLSAAIYAAKGRVPLEVYHDPHQEFLFVGVEIGLVGLALLAAGLVGLWRLAARFDDDWRWITRGVVVIYVSAGLFNGLLNIGWTGYFFGLLLALVAGRLAVAPPTRQGAS
jgi:O-antigen ligase